MMVEFKGKIPDDIQTDESARGAAGKASVKASVKTSVKILELLAEKPEMTLTEVASLVGKTVRAVEMASSKLIKEGKLIRMGSKKGGHWEVVDKKDSK